jgi:TatD DNase family protein
MSINKLHDTHLHLDLIENLPLLINEIDTFEISVIAVTNLPPLFTKLCNKKYSQNIKPALGFHPQLLREYNKYIPNMWELIQTTTYVGEVGLDIKSVNLEERKDQINFFIELIDKCHRIGGKILSVHSKGSDNEVLSIIPKNFNSKIIMHWYSGSISNIYPLLEKQCFFSINYAMVNSVKGQKIIQKIPIERILLESDSPFVKIDVKKAYKVSDLEKICQMISEIKRIPYMEVEKKVRENFSLLHKID